jgi:hypothetical protein
VKREVNFPPRCGRNNAIAIQLVEILLLLEMKKHYDAGKEEWNTKHRTYFATNSCGLCISIQTFPDDGEYGTCDKSD